MQEYLTTDRCNGGWVYVQNAVPNGPVAWLVAEVAEPSEGAPVRQLRAQVGRWGGRQGEGGGHAAGNDARRWRGT